MEGMHGGDAVSVSVCVCSVIMQTGDSACMRCNFCVCVCVTGVC